MLAESEVKLVQARFYFIADPQIAEADVVFEDLLPVVITTINTDGILQWVRVKLFIAFR